MTSIHAATRGLISNNIPLGLVTDGLIYIKVIIDKPSGGGSCKHGNLWLQKEGDREFLEIICALMPILDS